MLAIVSIFSFLFLTLVHALIEIEAPLLLALLISGSYLYLTGSLVFNKRWNIIQTPFAPVVVFKIIGFVGVILNLVTDLQFFLNLGQELVVAAIGFMFLILVDLVGVCSSNSDVKRMVYSRTYLFNRRYAVIVFGLIYAAGWFWRYYAMTHGLLYGTHLGTRLEVTWYSNLLGTFSLLSTICFWGLFAFGQRSKWLIPLFLIEVAWFIASGSKGAILIMVFSLLFIEFLRGSWRISNKVVLAGAGFLALSVVSFTFIQMYRMESQRIIIASGYQAFSPTAAIRNIEVNDLSVLPMLKAFSGRFNLGWRFSHIVDDVEKGHTDLWYGESFLACFYWFIPRSVWPEKPTFSMGRWFAETFLDWNKESRSEAGVTIWGEGYLNFGVVGALLVPMLWVAAVQWIYRRCVLLGEYGLIFYASTHYTILNSLASNVASPFALFCEYALILVLTNILIVFIARTRRGAA